ncbi:O-methyltransferase [Fistulina hepatica ATCC 64428]|uniref:O-methyltransferase n=1 Tax=Fistulina hepatica ATCC 64428 TaxID=1128425 RepID=A0A0D7AE24_9AGAR|nr:O-methyltransferase [Fistulina hepatica ATCC 64428]
MAENLKALARLILESVDTIDSSCTESGLLFPRLDQPFSPSSEAARNLPGVGDAINVVVAAAAQLIAETRNPVASLASMALGWTSSTCMEVVEEGHIPEILREAGPQGLHVNDIAKINGMNPRRLSHIMRHLATIHIFNETSPDVYSHNLLSSRFDTGKKSADLLKDSNGKHEGTDGIAAFVAMFPDDAGKSGLYIPDVMTDPKVAFSPHSHECALQKAFNLPAINYFQWIDTPEQSRRMRRIGMVMHGVSQMYPPDFMLKGFDFGSLKDGATVVDVGGGVGSVTLGLARQFPKINFVIQDLPNQLGQAEKFWTENYPEAYRSGRVKFIAHNFFEPYPEAIRAPDVFLVRMVIHDWSDPYAEKILVQLRKAAGPNTRMVFVDHILRHTCEAPASSSQVVGYDNVKPAPAPLLKNMGAATMITHQFGMIMTCMQNGEERTLENWQLLFKKSGWIVKEIKNTESTGTFHPHIICECDSA